MEQKKLTLAELIGNFVCRTSYDELPENVRYYTKYLILDHLGCVLGAKELPSSKIVVDLIKYLGGTEQATVLGHGLKTSMQNAALANATMGHGLEMDDDHRVACMHPGVPVIPAALAVGENYNRDGKALIESVALGLEAMIRIGEAFLGVSYRQGFHPTGTCGVFGAAVAAGKMMGLNAEKLVNAIGIAGSQAAGLREARAQGTFGKRLQAGHPSMCGVLSALLAERGFTGPATIFEGDYGFLRAYSYKDTYDGSRISQGLGTKWEMLDTSIKVHACCRWTAPFIDCTLDIMRNQPINVEEIEEIFARSSSMAIQALTDPVERKVRPTTVVDAQFSLPYGVAAAAVRKKGFVEEFTEESIRDPNILSVIPKVKWEVDPEDEKNYPDCYSASVTIKTKRGKEYKSRVMFPKGDPENPVTREELEDKFRNLGGKYLSKKKTDDLFTRIWKLENLGSITEFTKLLY